MKGLTLLEILIVILIMLLLVAGVFAIFNSADLIRSVDMGLLDLQGLVRQAGEGMSREIRQSGANIGAGIALDAGGSGIHFSIPDPANPANPPLPVHYFLNNQQIMREYPDGTGVTQALANHINALTFCCIGGANCSDCSAATFIQMRIQGAKTEKGHPLTLIFNEEVALRN